MTLKEKIEDFFIHDYSVDEIDFKLVSNRLKFIISAYHNQKERQHKTIEFVEVSCLVIDGFDFHEIDELEIHRCEVNGLEPDFSFYLMVTSKEFSQPSSEIKFKFKDAEISVDQS